MRFQSTDGKLENATPEGGVGVKRKEVWDYDMLEYSKCQYAEAALLISRCVMSVR
jgi:hypothetical protein